MDGRNGVEEIVRLVDDDNVALESQTQRLSRPLRSMSIRVCVCVRAGVCVCDAVTMVIS